MRPTLALAAALVLAASALGCDSSDDESEGSGGSGGQGGAAGSGEAECIVASGAGITGAPEALRYYFGCLREELLDAPLGYCLATQPVYDASRQSLSFQLTRMMGFFRVTAILDEAEDDGGAAFPIRLELGGDTPLLDNRAAFDAAHTRCGTDASLAASGENPDL